jgi:hypothetical protein
MQELSFEAYLLRVLIAQHSMESDKSAHLSFPSRSAGGPRILTTGLELRRSGGILFRESLFLAIWIRYQSRIFPSQELIHRQSGMDSHTIEGGCLCKAIRLNPCVK